MIQSNHMRRRQVLFGITATALAACSNEPNAAISAFKPTDVDPLAAFRIAAEAVPAVWFAHLQAPKNGKAPTVLAISAGGEDGAFGAGALTGWTTTGKRPEFDLVTGISSGALIAPFAFVGPQYDDVLKRIFTEYGAGDIMRFRPLQALSQGAIYNTEPLAELIENFTPDAFLDQVAMRHAAGGRLFIVTSEVETARAYVWNMGAIAQAGEYDLFRQIMRASAALPGLFSPVVLTYTVGGKTYQETHIDGGVHMQFLAVPSFAFTTVDQKLHGGHIYLLVNNTLNPLPVTVSKSALGISQQALTTMSRASALSAVNATQFFANENAIGLSVTSIDPTAGIVYDPSERFASDYMNALFEHGFERAKSGALWQTP
jgi:predicted acylesterase/phospholipase RssA